MVSLLCCTAWRGFPSNSPCSTAALGFSAAHTRLAANQVMQPEVHDPGWRKQRWCQKFIHQDCVGTLSSARNCPEWTVFAAPPCIPHHGPAALCQNKGCLTDGLGLSSLCTSELAVSYRTVQIWLHHFYTTRQAV